VVQQQSAYFSSHEALSSNPNPTPPKKIIYHANPKGVATVDQLGEASRRRKGWGELLTSRKVTYMGKKGVTVDRAGERPCTPAQRPVAFPGPA
jgi:hypothetical protein